MSSFSHYCMAPFVFGHHDGNDVSLRLEIDLSICNVSETDVCYSAKMCIPNF